MNDDLISRQAAIDIERNATVDTNPSHFEAHQKFTQFMDDAEISSFGRWQWSNGFNTALTAVGIDLKKLPSAQPDVPDTNVGDTISRQAAMRAFGLSEKTRKYGGDHSGYDTRMLYEIQDTLESLPSAEPKRGRWIKMSDADGVYYACSECGEELYREWTFDRQFDLFPKKTTIDKTAYCPNCGADMRGGDDEID